jgi:hypothetical protein
MRSQGVVFRSADGRLSIRLDFEKRYITLAPVATLIGLAVKLIRRLFDVIRLKPHGAGSQQIDITPVACGSRVVSNPTVHNCGTRCCELSLEKGNGACERKLYGSRLWYPEGIRLRQVYPDNDSIMKVIPSADGTITTGKVTVCGAANADRRSCVGAPVRSTPPPACNIVTPPPGVPGQGCVDPSNPGGRR